MTCFVQVVADSTCAGHRITTFKLTYWRAIHGEFMTHRVFSRNASSSRAIPVSRVLGQVWADPAGPIHWGANQRGMQARSELTGQHRTWAQRLWRWAGRAACGFAWGLMKLGLHKQVANRLLEPWQYITVVVTATDWDNFFALRCHPDAQPEIRELADTMRGALARSVPKALHAGEWHLPFVHLGDDPYWDPSVDEAVRVSVARCARTSYNNFDGEPPTLSSDLLLYDKLMGNEPRHASPAEHQATPCSGRHHNLTGWKSHRAFVEEQT